MITAGSLLAVLAGHLHLSHPQQVWCGEGEQAAPRGPLWRGGSQQHPLCSELSTPGAFHSCLSLDPHPPPDAGQTEAPCSKKEAEPGVGVGGERGTCPGLLGGLPLPRPALATSRWQGAPRLFKPEAEATPTKLERTRSTHRRREHLAAAAGLMTPGVSAVGRAAQRVPHA